MLIGLVGCLARGILDVVRRGRVRDATLKARLTTEEDLEIMADAWEEASLGIMYREILI